MNLTELRDVLDDLAGPLEAPTQVQRDAIGRRARRARLVSAARATTVVVLGLVVLLVIVAWPGTDDHTDVVTRSGRTLHDERLGYSVTIPPGWNLESQNVRPDDNLPIIMRLTSDDYTPGRLGADCASSVEQTGISIIMQENNVPDDSDPDLRARFAQPLPDHFGPDSGDGGLRTNPGGPFCHRLQQSIRVDTQGRHIYIGITMAPGTSPSRQSEAYAILDSLRFDRDTIVQPVDRDSVTTTTTG